MKILKHRLIPSIQFFPVFLCRAELQKSEKINGVQVGKNCAKHTIVDQETPKFGSLTVYGCVYSRKITMLHLT